MTLRRLFIFLIIVLAASPLLFGTAEKEVLSEAVPPGQIPILMYHKVSPYSADGGLGLRVPPDAFGQQMEYLKKTGYNPVSLNQLIDDWEKKAALPSKPIIITFDDGYEDNFTFAFPILKKYGYTATIFLVHDDIDGYNIWDNDKNVAHNIRLLSWKQINQMKNQGICFESHTLTHPDLRHLTPEEAQREITESKKKLEERLGTKVNFIAYPYGQRNPMIDQAVRQAGYRGAVTTQMGKNPPGTDPVLLKRLRVNGETTLKDFKEMLDG